MSVIRLKYSEDNFHFVIIGNNTLERQPPSSFLLFFPAARAYPHLHVPNQAGARRSAQDTRTLTRGRNQEATACPRRDCEQHDYHDESTAYSFDMGGRGSEMGVGKPPQHLYIGHMRSSFRRT